MGAIVDSGWTVEQVDSSWADQRRDETEKLWKELESK
ncbi:Uncharacterised protein [Mycobacteroides abscessus subsp. abscessus]|jgi:hypothetical protein|nr:Uncharacterised protein [Mycobacteroides abscessus subsp. abscessus]SKL78850.1 Uncharacterised protein [Mycobacteroides abscessus subsp. abscessus]SKM54142.1 Uncharacterised protein [Mycobacteroides abscessus subsp. abscessus]SLK35147.1 Uncharacterised protein [Mycobacteroides abscessus subsp. abscessus]